MEAAILVLKNYLGVRLTQQDALIERLYVHMTREFERVDARFEMIEATMSEGFKTANSRFDEIRCILDTDELECGAQSMQLDRHESSLQKHESWIKELQKHRVKPELS